MIGIAPGSIGRRVSSTLLLLLIAAAPLLPLAAAADSLNPGTVDTTVTVAAATPTVSFTLYSDPGYTTPTTEMVPQTPVYMKIDVSTDNVLEEITIEVQMFADTDPTLVGTPPTATDPAKYVNFTISYDTTTGQWVLTADTGGSTTWSIELDPNMAQPDPAATSGSFYVVITPGKVAAEASTSETAEAADWDIIVKAIVAGTASNTYSNSGYVMYFYSEVQPAVTSLDFGTLLPGSTSSIQQVSFTVIANGQYNITAVVPENFTYSTYTINLTTSKPGLGEFRMNASTSIDTTTNTLIDAKSLTNKLTTAPILLGDAPATTESGVTAVIYLQLELGTGIHTGQYTGSVQIYAIDSG